MRAALVETVRFDDQRVGEKGSDDVRRDRRDAPDRLHMNLRQHLDGLQAQPRLPCASRSRTITSPGKMRWGFLICWRFIRQIWPEPGFLEEFPGNSPQRVARDDDMALRERRRPAGVPAQRQRRQNTLTMARMNADIMRIIVLSSCEY
jgi:hypothetical protein